MYELQQLLSPIIRDTDILNTSSGVKLPDGSFYENDILLHSNDGKNHVFLRVTKIVFCAGEPYVFCEECITVCYDIHYHAYEIQTGGTYMIIEISRLKTSHVLGMYNINGVWYVPLKFDVVNVL